MHNYPYEFLPILSSDRGNLFVSEANKTKKRRKSPLIRLIPHHRFNFCAHAAEHVKRDDTNARISFVPDGHFCKRSHVIAKKSYSAVWPPFTESAMQLRAIDYEDIRASNVAFHTGNLPSLQARILHATISTSTREPCRPTANDYRLQYNLTT